MIDVEFAAGGRMGIAGPGCRDAVGLDEDAGKRQAAAVIAYRVACIFWLATGHTDMRKGFDGLALLVQEKLKHDPHGEHIELCQRRIPGQSS